jgi:hypothetical protein
MAEFNQNSEDVLHRNILPGFGCHEIDSKIINEFDSIGCR